MAASPFTPSLSILSLSLSLSFFLSSPLSLIPFPLFKPLHSPSSHVPVVLPHLLSLSDSTPSPPQTPALPSRSSALRGLCSSSLPSHSSRLLWPQGLVFLSPGFHHLAPRSALQQPLMTAPSRAINNHSSTLFFFQDLRLLLLLLLLQSAPPFWPCRNFQHGPILDSVHTKVNVKGHMG